MKNIRIGTDNFEQLIREDAYYVDKTKMIEEILDKKSGVMLFPRPRRFGKTLTMSMLENFFNIEKKEQNKDLFKDLYIENSKYYELRNTSPVIFLTFKKLKQDNYELMYDNFKEMIANLYASTRYLYNTLDGSEQEYFDLMAGRKGNVAQYQNSIVNLSNYLERYYNKKVIILIDEYDVPIQQGYIKGFYKDAVSFIRSVFDNALKTNGSLDFAVMTGVLRVSKESIFSDLNNVKVYGILNSEFTEYFGFTESETRTLLEYYGLELNDEVKSMYDGYIFNNTNIYNPWSITNYAKDKMMGVYWVNTSSNDLIKNMIMNTTEENRKVIEGLVQGISNNFIYNEKLTYKDFDDYINLNTILNLMFTSGYLTIDTMYDLTKGTLRIPNNEVKTLINEILSETILGNRMDIAIDIRSDIENSDLVSFEKDLNKVLASMSYMDSYEAFYHGSMLGLFTITLSDSYIIKSNRETGKGRCDILLERADKSLGYIFEFKVVDDEDLETIADTALSQIEEKEYYKELILDKVQNIIKVAVIFKDKMCIVRSR